MPWYEIPHTGGAVMFLDHKRPDLKLAKAPKRQKPAEEAEPQQPETTPEAPAEAE